MTSKHETLERLYGHIIDDLQAMIKLLDRQAAGENVTRELDELESAIDVKMAMVGGLRKQWRED